MEGVVYNTNMTQILLYDKNVAKTQATIRYLSQSGKYVIRGYLNSIKNVGELKVDEYDLLAVIYKEYELAKDLDDDTLNDLKCFVYVFKISPTVLKEARIQWHRKRLNRCLTSVVYLEYRKHTRVAQRMTQNIENYEVVYENCLKKGRYEEFIALNKEWCKYNGIKFSKVEWTNKYREAIANRIK